MGFEGVGVTSAHFRRDFERDVDELPEVKVVGWVGLVVAEGGDIFRRSPGVDGFDGGEFRGVDIDDGSVRSHEFVVVSQGRRVDFFGDNQSIAVGFSQADDFFEPGGSCRFHMKAHAVLFDEAVDDGIE